MGLGRTSVLAAVALGVTVTAVTLSLGGSMSPSLSSPVSSHDAVTVHEVGIGPGPWGVQQLRATRAGGTVWYADWDDHRGDSWIHWARTDALHEVHPNAGVMELGGDTVRMYVRDPDVRARQQWTGALEITVYARRVPGSGPGTAYSGIVTDARTNHGSVDGGLYRHPCDSRGLLARLRFDGYADFGKEVRHPNTVARHAVQVWPGGMPTGLWIGYKHLVYDTDDGVAQELWVDFPGGSQHWVLVNRIVDHGGNWGAGERACAPGVNPSLPLRGGTGRAGSESGLPNVAVLFRADNLHPDGGLEYRRASVREVE